MATYETLRDRALSRVGQTGQTEAQLVAQAALEEAMRFVAFHVRILSLIGSATATAPANASDESSAITLGSGGFNITSTYQTPDRLYVKNNSSADNYGTPYEFREYPHFIDLQSISSSSRSNILTPTFDDERPNFCYTETPSGKIWAQPLDENNVLTLFYRKSPAAYSASGTPEIHTLFDHILVNGAEMVLKEWLREPESITSMWSLFESLLPQIEEYDKQINSGRKRRQIKIHRSYRVR